MRAYPLGSRSLIANILPARARPTPVAFICAVRAYAPSEFPVRLARGRGVPRVASVSRERRAETYAEKERAARPDRIMAEAAGSLWEFRRLIVVER